MRVFVTGGTGFIGGRVVERLRARGDEVVALVRSPARATALIGLGCELVEGDLADRVAIERGLDGADAAFHIAAMFEAGIPRSHRARMDDVNIGGTRRVMDAAMEAGTGKVVYVSTMNVLGDTRGAVVDESYERPDLDFASWYERTKYQSHQIVMDRIGKGAPVVVVEPAVVYGPGDHFEIGREILLAARGRLLARMLTDIGVTMAYVDDVADGIVLALDRGTIGEAYLLGGERATLDEILERAAALTGRTLTRRRVPTWLLRALAPTAPWWAPRLGYPPNLRELIKVADGATYWVNDDKARDALGYRARSLDEGLRATLGAAGIDVAPAP